MIRKMAYSRIFVFVFSVCLNKNKKKCSSIHPYLMGLRKTTRLFNLSLTLKIEWPMFIFIILRLRVTYICKVMFFNQNVHC